MKSKEDQRIVPETRKGRGRFEKRNKGERKREMKQMAEERKSRGENGLKRDVKERTRRRFEKSNTEQFGIE